MKKILNIFILAVFFLGTGISISRANTDQRCLSLCIDSGGTTSVCLPKCSYEATPLTNPMANAATKNNVFNAPSPLDELVLPKPTVNTVSIEKDYKCEAQCMQSGAQYGLCEKLCIKPPCPTGKALCDNSPVYSAGALFKATDLGSATSSPRTK